MLAVLGNVGFALLLPGIYGDLEVLENLIGTQQNLKVFTFTTDIFGVLNFQTFIFSLFFWGLMVTHEVPEIDNPPLIAMIMRYHYSKCFVFVF